MNKIQAANNSHQHSHHHEAQDNCDGCQAERRENNMLVDFYERLNKIESKVDKIKDNVTTQQAREHGFRQKIQDMNNMLTKKPEDALKLIKQHDSKEMGYELASALIEREIKTKQENQRLQAIIQQLQKDKVILEEQKKRHLSHENTRPIAQPTQRISHKAVNHHSRYSDVIDEVRRTNDSSYFIDKPKAKDMTNSYFDGEAGKKYWEDASMEQDQTSFSSFTAALKKEKSKSEDRHQYEGLNLWLYQFKPEQIDQTPIKSLKKPANQKKIINVQGKNKPKV